MERKVIKKHFHRCLTFFLISVYNFFGRPDAEKMIFLAQCLNVRKQKHFDKLYQLKIYIVSLKFTFLLLWITSKLNFVNYF